MHEKTKILFLLLTAVLLSASAAAQDVQVDGLTATGVNYTANESHVTFHNSEYLNKSISYQELFIPEQHQDDLYGSFDTVSYSNEEHGQLYVQLQYQYNYNSGDTDDDVPDSFSRFYVNDQEVNVGFNEENNGLDRIFNLSFSAPNVNNEDVSIEIDVEAHYEHLILEYTYRNESGHVVGSYEDVYSGEEPELIPIHDTFLGKTGFQEPYRNRIGITPDNWYQDRKNVTAIFAFEKDEEIVEKDFPNNAVEVDAQKMYDKYVNRAKETGRNRTLLENRSDYDLVAFNTTLNADSRQRLSILTTTEVDSTEQGHAFILGSHGGFEAEGDSHVYEFNGSSESESKYTEELVAGTYEVAVHGADGGAYGWDTDAGGTGGYINGTFSASSSDTLEIWVGQKGSSTDQGGWGRYSGGAGGEAYVDSFQYGSRGGGSTEILLNGDVLAVADGGGGAAATETNREVAGGGGGRCGLGGNGSSADGNDAECPTDGTGFGGDGGSEGSPEGEDGGQAAGSALNVQEETTGGATQDADGHGYVELTLVETSSGGNSPPTANYSYTPSSPGPGDTISFDASSSSDPDGSISSYEWDWTSDGNYEATGQIASHSYGTTGSYDVTLRVTDDAGATDTYTETISVSDQSPPTTTSNATSDWQAKDQDTVELTATDSESSVANVTYSVDGGAETTETGSSATVTISGDSNHTLEYYAWDSEGNKESVNTEYIALDSTPPQYSDATFEYPSTYEWGMVSNFSTSWSDATSGMNERKLETDFAGAAVNESVASKEAELAAGSYTVRFWGVDQAGNVNSRSESFTVDKADTVVDIYFSGNASGTTVVNSNYSIDEGRELNITAFVDIPAASGQITDALFDLYRDGGEVGTLSGNSIEYLDSGLSPGTYYFNSTWHGNENYSAFSRDPTVTVRDTPGPNLTVHSPETGEAYSSTSIDLGVTSESEVDTWMYSLDSSENTTFTPNTTLSALAEGGHEVVVWANDSVDDWSRVSASFEVDTTVPSATIHEPENVTYNSSNIPLSVTGSDDVRNWTYTLDGLNSSFTPNATLSGLADGQHNVLVWAVDDVGNSVKIGTTYFNVSDTSDSSSGGVGGGVGGGPSTGSASVSFSNPTVSVAPGGTKLVDVRINNSGVDSENTVSVDVPDSSVCQPVSVRESNAGSGYGQSGEYSVSAGGTETVSNMVRVEMPESFEGTGFSCSLEASASESGVADFVVSVEREDGWFAWWDNVVATIPFYSDFSAIGESEPEELELTQGQAVTSVSVIGLLSVVYVVRRS